MSTNLIQRLLLVEDNPVDARLLRSMFKERDSGETELTHVECMSEAETHLATHSVDLILLDLGLRDAQGLEAVRRAHAAAPHVPLVVLTGLNDESMAVQALQEGAQDYLLKSELQTRGLMRALRYAIERKAMEEALSAERERAQVTLTLLAHSPAVIYGLIVDDQTTSLYLVSENIAQLLGFSVSETLHYPWWLEHLHPDDRSRAVDSLAETLAHGTSRTEYRMRHKGGEYRWLEDNRRLLRDAAGAPTELTGVWTDITERKRAESVLRGSERRFREIMENVDLIAMTIDKQGLVTFCNEFLLRLTGWTREEVIGADWFAKFIPASDTKVSEVFFEHIGRGAIPPHYENQIRTRTNELREIVWSNTVLLDENGTVVGTASIGDDVTVRRRADAELRQSEERFRELAENIQEVFWMTDPVKSQILYVSPAYEKIWGRTCESLYAEPRSWLDAVHPDDRESVLHATLTKQAEGKFDEQFRIIRPDGSIRWIHDHAAPVRNAAGEVCRIAGVAEDITARRQLEEQFRQSQKMEAIGTLAGGIAHDFNNLLAVIGGYTELLRSSFAQDPEVTEDLDAVALATSRAASLVRQILTFSRNEETRRKPVQLAPVVEEAVAFLRSTLPSTIEIHVAVTTDELNVLADATQIHQIVMNLGTNAWHSMQDRPGRIDVELESFEVDRELAELKPDLRPGRYARLSVRDTGLGMDAATVDRIFEPFFTTKPVGKGTGLGLAVVHGIMQSHEGAITVDSQPGQGAAFRLYFPLHATAASEMETYTTAIAPGRGERILYVDDELPLVRLGRKLLERLGYVVETYTNVEEALSLVRAEPDRFDLVVTDQTMPGMTGVDFACAVARVRPDLPVILTTGYTGQMTMEHLRTAGIRELLIKPPTLHSLGTLVHRALSDKVAR